MHEKKTKLKIVLTSSKTNAASYIQYKQNLNEINLDSDNTDIILDISNDPKNVQYNLYDIALFMGYDEASKLGLLILELVLKIILNLLILLLPTA